MAQNRPKSAIAIRFSRKTLKNLPRKSPKNKTGEIRLISIGIPNVLVEIGIAYWSFQWEPLFNLPRKSPKNKTGVIKPISIENPNALNRNWPCALGFSGEVLSGFIEKVRCKTRILKLFSIEIPMLLTEMNPVHWGFQGALVPLLSKKSDVKLDINSNFL